MSCARQAPSRMRHTTGVVGRDAGSCQDELRPARASSTILRLNSLGTSSSLGPGEHLPYLSHGVSTESGEPQSFLASFIG